MVLYQAEGAGQKGLSKRSLPLRVGTEAQSAKWSSRKGATAFAPRHTGGSNDVAENETFCMSQR